MESYRKFTGKFLDTLSNDYYYYNRIEYFWQWNLRDLSTDLAQASRLQSRCRLTLVCQSRGSTSMTRSHPASNVLSLSQHSKYSRTTQAPSDAVAIPGHWSGEFRVPIICFSTSDQKQVDWLSQIIGKRTRWWLIMKIHGCMNKIISSRFDIDSCAVKFPSL